MNEENPVKAYLKTVQLWRLRDVKEAAQSLIKIADQTIKKVDNEGLNGRFSAHHDCLEKAQRLHRASNELYRLRTLIEKIDALEKENAESPPAAEVQEKPQPKAKRRKKKN